MDYVSAPLSLADSGAFRTNPTFRQSAPCSASRNRRPTATVADVTRHLAGMLGSVVSFDRRWSWTLDATLVPTHDHTAAGKSKNYRGPAAHRSWPDGQTSP